MRWVVYIIRFPNKKKYVGVTKHSLGVRVGQHVKAAAGGSDLTLSYAIRKYGTDSLKTGTLARCSSDTEAKSLEVEYIKEIGTLRPHGYNSTVGGNGVLDPSGMSEGKRLTRMKRTMSTKEYKKRQHQIQMEVWNEERKMQRSDEVKQLWANPEYRGMQSKSHYQPDAKCHLPKVLLTHEEKSKIYKSIWNRPGHREKVKSICKKAMSNPALRLRIGNKMKKLMADPEYRKRHSERMKAAMNRPEVRLKCRLSHLKQGKAA